MIRNVVVGRSSTAMRLFVTCSATNGSTVVKLVDRVVMVHKAVGIEESAQTEVVFVTVPFTLKIETDSQPFIADLNGDFLEDILYTESGTSASIMVAYQLPSTSDATVDLETSTVSTSASFFTTSFDSLVLKDNFAEDSEGNDDGCISKQIENKRMTVPHSTALVDFDGDCLADLFVTIQDLTTGKKYYEIYLRREQSTTVDINASTVKA